MLKEGALAKLPKIISAWERSDEKTHQTLLDITLRCLCGVQQMRFLPDLSCLKDWMFENYLFEKIWANDFSSLLSEKSKLMHNRVYCDLLLRNLMAALQICKGASFNISSQFIKYNELVCKVRKSYAFFHEITLLKQSNTGV